MACCLYRVSGGVEKLERRIKNLTVARETFISTQRLAAADQCDRGYRHALRVPEPGPVCRHPRR